MINGSDSLRKAADAIRRIAQFNCNEIDEGDSHQGEQDYSRISIADPAHREELHI
jgi:hypothetical protein